MAPARSLPLRRTHPLLRSCRPPDLTCLSRPRPFTHNSRLLLLTPATLRPQLPYLSQASQAQRTRRGGQWQISRLLTTERRQYLREQMWLSGKYIAVSSAVFVCLVSIAFGVNGERLERRYPSPREWTMISRINYRDARWSEEPEAEGTGVVDWARTGNLYRQLIRRLEDPAADGKNIRRGPGHGQSIEANSYPWRRGYFEALRGAARAAENLDGWVRDVTRNLAFPAEVVIGPSNANPRPCPPGSAAAPLEENCEAGFEAPEAFYSKILSTDGFSTAERLDAVLAWADWAAVKGRVGPAEELHKQGIAIALQGLSHDACVESREAPAVVDPESGVIRSSPSPVSSNILLASTSLAVFYAQTANFSSALPIFISVLRARRSLPAAPASGPKELKSSSPSSLQFLRSLVVPSPYPPQQPTGDMPAVRTAAGMCEEAGVMAYIGEVLFASSSRSAGLAWTRDAVALAETQFAHTAGDADGRERCQECLEVGLANWHKMVGRLAREEKTRGTASSWSLWTGGEKDGDKAQGKWEKEVEAVEARARQVRTLLGSEGKSSKAGSGTLLFA